MIAVGKTQEMSKMKQVQLHDREDNAGDDSGDDAGDDI